MARTHGKVGAALMGAALAFGSLAAVPAFADDMKKAEKQVGEAAADRVQFVGKLAVFDAKQIQLAKLALEKSSDPQVQQFANALIRDHRANLDTLQTWADAKQIEMAVVDDAAMRGTGGSGSTAQQHFDKKLSGANEKLGKEIDKAREQISELRAKDGKDFDKAFLSRVIDDQEDGKDLLKDGMGKYKADATFSALLAKTSTVVDSHIKSGEKLKDVVD